MLEWLCILPLIGSLISDCTSAAALAVGYVEGEYVLIASIDVAQIKSLNVRRGDRVLPKQPLAELEKRDAELVVAQANAALKNAKSQANDKRYGKRAEEITVIKATLMSAIAQQKEAARVLLRQSDLTQKGLGTPASLDKASTALAVADAKVAEMKATLAFASLPARTDVIAALDAVVLQAQATLDAARWRLTKRTLFSLKAGTVFDIIRNPGEIAGPQAPVLSILPDDGVKLRLYVSQKQLHNISIGSKLTVRCDGCIDRMTATVNYVADDPEYTPPIIYSLESRQKLVYLIEAVPDDSAAMLKPGQIIDVVVTEKWM